MSKKIAEIGCHVKLKKKKKEINKTRHEIQRDDALCCIKLKIDIKQVWKLEESCSWLLYEIKKRKKIEYSRNKLEKIETKSLKQIIKDIKAVQNFN